MPRGAPQFYQSLHRKSIPSQRELQLLVQQGAIFLFCLLFIFRKIFKSQSPAPHVALIWATAAKDKQEKADGERWRRRKIRGWFWGTQWALVPKSWSVGSNRSEDQLQNTPGTMALDLRRWLKLCCSTRRQVASPGYPAAAESRHVFMWLCVPAAHRTPVATPLLCKKMSVLMWYAAEDLISAPAQSKYVLLPLPAGVFPFNQTWK